MRYYSHTVFFYILLIIFFRYAEILKNGSLRHPGKSQIPHLCFLIVFRREISYFRSHHLTKKREARRKPNFSLFLQKKLFSTRTSYSIHDRLSYFVLQNLLITKLRLYVMTSSTTSSGGFHSVSY